MTAKSTKGTYVYCVIASSRAPALRGTPKGLIGAGPVRLLELTADGRSRRSGLRRWLVVADIPLDRYSEESIEAGLGDLDWVSRAAVAHEAVVEFFITAAGLLPMKLFTIFTSDDRAVAHSRTEGRRIDGALARVLNRNEWGVRVMLSGAATRRTPARPDAGASGSVYLERKKAQRDASVELAERARAVVAELYDLLSQRSTIARRRAVTTAPGQRAPLLLDAVFLVPRARSSTFQATVKRRARALEAEGYVISLTGPWPPYSFIQD